MKKLVFLSLFLLHFFFPLQAALAAPVPNRIERVGEFCRYAIYSISARPRGGPMPLFDFHQVTLPTNSLEYRFCERLFPNSIAQAFSVGFDIPANDLQISKSEILTTADQQANTSQIEYREREQRRTAPGIPDIRIQRSMEYTAIPNAAARESVEWALLLNFNLTAAEIWDEILHCNPNAEQARANYRLGNFCLEKKQTAELAEKFRAYRGNIRNFLQSASIKDLKGASLFPIFHPLFTQAILEEMSIAQINAGVDRHSFSFPESRALLFYSGKDHSKLYLEMYDFNGRGLLQFAHLKTLINSVFILQMVSDEDCRQWGLWPAISRNLIHSYDTVSSELYDQIERTRAKINFACGDISRLDPSLYSYQPRGTSYREFIRTFREMAKRF